MPKKSAKQKTRLSSFLGRFKFLLFALAFGLIGCIALLRSRAATVSEPPIGLMIQVSTLGPTHTPATVKSWLQNVQKNHRNRLKQGYIDTIVLQDITDQNGKLLTDYLDVITPYLPGGKTPIFDKAYIGTIDLDWSGSGSKYIEGIGNPAFRQKNIDMSATAATAFYKRYPRVNAHWYITYEANLSGFWDNNIKTSYLTYINAFSDRMSKIKAKEYMWSPAFWTPYRQQPSWALPGLKANFADFFGKTRVKLHMNIQDFVGQSGGVSTKEDAVVWAKYLKTNWSPRMMSIQINAEQFHQTASGGITATTTAKLAERETYYQKQGFKVGPSWEIRYWHKRMYGR